MEPLNPYLSPDATKNHDENPVMGSVTTRRRMSIRKMDVLSVAKMLGALYAMIGLVVSLFMGAAMILGGIGGGIGLAEGLVGSIGTIIVIPLMYGIGGFIGGALLGLFYNVTAGIVGGIVLEIEV